MTLIWRCLPILFGSLLVEAVEAPIFASGSAAGQKFGYGIAVSSSGSTLVVGAVGTFGTSSGSTFVYPSCSSGSCGTRIALVNPHASVQDEFGTAVAINTDGTRVASSSPGTNYVMFYTCTTTACVNKASLLDPNGAGASSSFGTAIALSDDGTRPCSRCKNENWYCWCGVCVFVYCYELYWSVDIQRSENTLAFPSPSAAMGLGCWLEVRIRRVRAVLLKTRLFTRPPHAAADGTSIAAAYYYYCAAVSSCGSMVTLTKSGGVAADYFGQQVALSGDGARVAIGAYGVLQVLAR